MNNVIGIDFGGTNLRIGIVDKNKNILEKKIYNTHSLLRSNLIIDTISDSVINSKYKISAVGIGVPGIILIDKGIVVESPNLPLWENFELKRMIEEKIDIPVFLDNDANLVAYGEKCAGAGEKINNFICITLGTGVGGGIILNDEIWHGRDGMAGEIGHTVVETNGEKCKCGSHGCLEVYASANAIIRMAKEGIISGNKTEIKNMIKGDLDKIDSYIIYKAALKGDELSLKIYERVGRYLGIAIANIMNLLNIDGIIIGGGVSNTWDLFIDSLKKEVNERAYSYIVNNTEIIKSKLVDDAGIIGASCLAFKNLYAD